MEKREPKQTKKVDYGAINIARVDYKDASILRKFTDPYGRIISRRKTNISAAQQRQVSDAIKRARFMGFLPYVAR